MKHQVILAGVVVVLAALTIALSINLLFATANVGK